MSQTKCKHCKNKKNKTVMVQCDVDGDIYFCCNGCKSVHLLLNDKDEQKEDKPKKRLISKLKKSIMSILNKIKR